MVNEIKTQEEKRNKWSLPELILYLLVIIIPIILIGMLFANIFAIKVEVADAANQSSHFEFVYYSILDITKNDTVKMLGITYIVLNFLGLIASGFNIYFFKTKSVSYFRYLPLISLFVIYSILTFVSYVFSLTIYGSIGTFSLLIIALLFIITFYLDNKRIGNDENVNEVDVEN